MPTWERAPHPALRGCVAAYIGYRDQLDPGLVHHGLPSTTITVILSLDRPLDTGWLALTTGTRPYWALAAGLHVEPSLVRPHGYQAGVQLALTPWGCRALLGLPPAALAGEIVDLAELSVVLGRAGVERLNEAAGWDERFALLDEVLLQALGRGSEGRGEGHAFHDLARVWDLILTSGGRRWVSDLAAEVSRSPRWLSSRFAAEYGVTPQQARRLCRFETSLGMARQRRPLAEVAAAAGYADQAHLSRDWKTLSALTPTQLLGSPYRFLQDPEERAMPGSGS